MVSRTRTPSSHPAPRQTTVQDPETGKEFSAVNCYFMQQDGQTFKAQVWYAPYFLLATKPDCEHDVEAFLRRRYEGKIHDVLVVEKEDLDLKNHLSGLKQALPEGGLRHRAGSDGRAPRGASDGEEEPAEERGGGGVRGAPPDGGDERRRRRPRAPPRDGTRRRERWRALWSCREQRASAAWATTPTPSIDIREYDVPYHMRWLIDTNAGAGGGRRARERPARFR